jgi:hypothetical protein
MIRDCDLRKMTPEEIAQIKRQLNYQKVALVNGHLQIVRIEDAPDEADFLVWERGGGGFSAQIERISISENDEKVAALRGGDSNG